MIKHQAREGVLLRASRHIKDEMHMRRRSCLCNCDDFVLPSQMGADSNDSRQTTQTTSLESGCPAQPDLVFSGLDWPCTRTNCT